MVRWPAILYLVNIAYSTLATPSHNDGGIKIREELYNTPKVPLTNGEDQNRTVCGRVPGYKWDEGGAFCEVKTRHTYETRISKGYAATLGQFPSYVRLTIKGSDEMGKEGIDYCGGVLIDKDRVLTARHCVDKNGFYAKSCRVEAGMANLDNRAYRQKRFAWGFCVLPGDLASNDIALIQLRKGMDLNKYVQPACMALDKTHRDEAMCYSVGMGWSKWSGENQSKQLLLLPMKRKCNESEIDHPETTSCYKAVQQGLLGHPCVGDSGGGLYCMDKCDPKMTIQWVFGVASHKYAKGCEENFAEPVFFSDLFKQRKKVVKAFSDCYEFVPEDERGKS